MTIANTATEYRDLPLSILTESQTNPRRIFDHEALKELAESLEVIQRTSAVILGALEEPSPEESQGQSEDTSAQTTTTQTVAEDAAPEPRRNRRTRSETATTEAAA